MDNLVTVKSTIKGAVGLVVPSHNFMRRWTGKGAIHRIPLSTLEEIIYDEGVNYMFKSGILYIEDMNAKIKLGLEEPGTKEPTKIVNFTEEQQVAMLKVGSLEALKKNVDAMSEAQVEDLAILAGELQIADMNKIDLLQEKTGIDILGYISEKKEEERERKAKENENK